MNAQDTIRIINERIADVFSIRMIAEPSIFTRPTGSLAIYGVATVLTSRRLASGHDTYDSEGQRLERVESKEAVVRYTIVYNSDFIQKDGESIDAFEVINVAERIQNYLSTSEGLAHFRSEGIGRLDADAVSFTTQWNNKSYLPTAYFDVTVSYETVLGVSRYPEVLRIEGTAEGTDIIVEKEQN